MNKRYPLIAFLSVLCISLSVFALPFCCPIGQEEACCAGQGRVYCPEEGVCRTRCLARQDGKCAGCVNPEGVCCPFCPTAEVCGKNGKCQKIVDGCYQCVECDPDCPWPKCLNEEGTCCDSCPRTCPEGQCLIAVDGCYECGECPDTKATETIDSTDTGLTDTDSANSTDSTEATETTENTDTTETTVSTESTESTQTTEATESTASSDDTATGECEEKCDEEKCEVCEDGSCVSSCEEGQECCGGTCITKCDANKCEECWPEEQKCVACPGGICCKGQCYSVGEGACSFFNTATCQMTTVPCGGYCLAVWACGIPRNEYADIIDPDDVFEQYGALPCSEILDRTRCECKEGSVQLENIPQLNFHPQDILTSGACCPSKRVCANICCESEEQDCVYQHMTISGYHVADAKCCDKGKGCYTKSGAPLCCGQNEACDGSAGRCCEVDDNGNYPPVLTENEIKTCKTIYVEESGCMQKKDACTEGEECCNGTCCNNGCNEAGDDCAEITETTEPDLCNGISCPAGQECDPATGDCICAEGKTTCGSGENTWCCDSSNTCGDSQGQCCLGGTCCGEGQKAVPITGRGNYGGGYLCCSADAGGAIRTNIWNNVFTWCCENGTVPSGGGENCCLPGETSYDNGSRLCCPADYTLDNSNWPAACCPPDKTACAGFNYWTGEDGCCDYECCKGKCCEKGEHCEIDILTERDCVSWDDEGECLEWEKFDWEWGYCTE